MVTPYSAQVLQQYTVCMNFYWYYTLIAQCDISLRYTYFTRLMLLSEKDVLSTMKSGIAELVHGDILYRTQTNKLNRVKHTIRVNFFTDLTFRALYFIAIVTLRQNAHSTVGSRAAAHC